MAQSAAHDDKVLFVVKRVEIQTMISLLQKCKEVPLHHSKPSSYRDVMSSRTISAAHL